MTLSMNDGLLHYGKKGMKWGVRNAAKAYGKMVVNRTVHPIKSRVEETKDSFRNPHTLLLRKPSDARRINTNVANSVKRTKDSKAKARLQRAVNERNTIKKAFDKKVGKRKPGSVKQQRAIKERDTAVAAFDRKVAKRKK